MIRQFLLQYFGAPEGTSVLGFFALAIAVVVGGLVWLLRSSGEPESMFKLREADRVRTKEGGTSKRDSKSAQASRLAEARMGRAAGVLRLEGIRIDGQPHEVLGVSPTASADQVQKAYRELMKRFHPDRVGRPGSREWADAQKIAEAINRAKESLLKKS